MYCIKGCTKSAMEWTAPIGRPKLLMSIRLQSDKHQPTGWSGPCQMEKSNFGRKEKPAEPGNIAVKQQ